MKKIISILLCLIMLVVFTACDDKEYNFFKIYEFGEVSVILRKSKDSDKVKVINEVETFLSEFEKSFSIKSENSDVNRINNSGNEKVLVSDHVISVLNISKDMYVKTFGAFNPCIYPLVDLWGFSPKYVGQYSKSRVEPNADEISLLLKNIDFDLIKTDGNYVCKDNSSLKIDLGGVAKGYGADKIAEILRLNNVNGIIEFSGIVNIVGDKEGADYVIAITDPRSTINSNKFLCVLNMSDTSLNTSGDYERYYIFNDKRYSHIISPFTGKPIDTGVISVSIIMDSAAISDALSTAVAVLGFENGCKLLEDMGVNAIVVSDSYKYKIVGKIDINSDYEIYEKYSKS